MYYIASKSHEYEEVRGVLKLRLQKFSIYISVSAGAPGEYGAVIDAVVMEATFNAICLHEVGLYAAERYFIKYQRRVQKL